MKESIDIIERIVMMHLFILSMVQGSWLVLPHKPPTYSIDRNLELRMAGDKPAAGM
jgi:hypothetical protein